MFGIGLSRTGTKSLTQALRRLGYTATHFPFTLEEIDRHDAATDTSVAYRFEELDFRYPGSKFILTVRETESWLDSCERHWAVRAPIDALSQIEREVVERTRMSLYAGLDFDRERFRSAYFRHRERVLAYFSDRPDDLLVIDICAGEGWEKLCAFLHKPIPDFPFPRITVARAQAGLPRKGLAWLSRLARRSHSRQ